MNFDKNQIQKINEAWLPKLEKKLGKDRFNQINPARRAKVAQMCHTRKVYENASTLANTTGRGSYNLGNNPSNGYGDFYSVKGSSEVFQNLFGVFVEVASNNVGMELVPLIPMTKSSGAIHIAEPIYAGGKIDSATDTPEVFQVKITKNSSPAALAVGTSYTITEGAAGDDIIDVTFVGVNRLNGNYIFKVGQRYDNSGGGGTDYTAETIATCLDTTTNSARLTSAPGHYTFAGGVDYVAGFTNFIAGFSGAGLNDTDAWFANRGTGKHYGKPMSRETGEKTYYRNMGIRMWHHNFAADTVHVDISYTTEQIQDMQMDHGYNALEFGDSILQDQLNQHINEHILGRMFALGWSHHHQMNAANGFNLNAFIASAASTGSAQAFLGKEDTLLTISGPAGVLPSSGAISENMSSLQRRIVSRLLYSSGIINTRSRRGRGDQAVMSTKFTTALKDIRGYREAEFPNDLNDSGLYMAGSLYGIKVYEDPLMDLEDERINVSRKGNEKDPGIKMCPFILGEKISTIAENTMAPKEALKSRYSLVEAGTNPELNYITFTVQTSSGYAII